MADEVVTKDVVKELGFTNWLTKIIERGNIVLDCMKSRCDIKQEDDWAIIEMLHKNWFFGEHILYETITVPDLSKSSTQASLFDDKNTNTVTFDDERNKILDSKVIKKDTPRHKKLTCHGK
jgi:hypothetical protein